MNSHIIPEFQYKPLYDKNHRALSISSDASEPESTIRQGKRERLLCRCCEGRLSKWEDHAARVFFQDAANMVRRFKSYAQLEGIDYGRFKLFLMSLLWRMGVAEDYYWKEVKLGPHEELLRTLLVASDPATSDVYPCMMTAVTIDGKFFPEWMSAPESFRFQGHQAYRVVLHGVLFTFVVSNHPLRFEIGQVAINEQGHLKIFVKEARDLPYVNQMFCAFGEAVRARKNLEN